MTEHGGKARVYLVSESGEKTEITNDAGYPEIGMSADYQRDMQMLGELYPPTPETIAALADAMQNAGRMLRESLESFSLAMAALGEQLRRDHPYLFADTAPDEYEKARRRAKYYRRYARIGAEK